MPCGTPRGVTHGMKSWRLLLLVALLLSLFLLGRALGLTSLSAAQLRATLGGAGPAGALLFLGAFVLGELVHIPGLVFVAVAVLGYGRLGGFLLGYLGALLSVSVAFALFRGVGGQALGVAGAGAGIALPEGSWLRRPFFRRLLQHLADRPLRAVVVLRLLFIMTPAVNALLALSPLRFRHFLAGSAIGLLPAIAVVALLGDWLARRL